MSQLTESELRLKLRNLIGQGRLDEALDLFDNETADAEILALKARLEILQQKQGAGILTHEQQTIETNSIISGLLVWINRPTPNAIPLGQTGPGITPAGSAEKLQVDEELLALIKTKLNSSLPFYYLITFLPLVFGLLLAAFFAFDGGIDALEGLGSALISAVGGLPLREVINRRDRINFLDILLAKADDLTDQFEIEKVNNLSWSIIESTILKAQVHA